MSRTLATDKDGNISWCSVPPEKRGQGNCPHVGHQNSEESVGNFMKRVEKVSANSEVMNALVADANKREGGLYGRGVVPVESNKMTVEVPDWRKN